MERSVGADALLEESWTTPWLDDRTFPYWPEAARMGDLGNFVGWLQGRDEERAALVVRHASEFEKVHRLVTRELARTKHSGSGNGVSNILPNGGGFMVRYATTAGRGMTTNGGRSDTFSSRGQRSEAVGLSLHSPAAKLRGTADRKDHAGRLKQSVAATPLSTTTRHSRSADGTSSGSSNPTHPTKKEQRRQPPESRSMVNNASHKYRGWRAELAPGGVLSWPPPTSAATGGGIRTRSSGGSIEKFTSYLSARHPHQTVSPTAARATAEPSASSARPHRNHHRPEPAIALFGSAAIIERSREHFAAKHGVRRHNRLHSLRGTNAVNRADGKSANSPGVAHQIMSSSGKKVRRGRSSSGDAEVDVHSLAGGANEMAQVPGDARSALSTRATTSHGERGRDVFLHPRQLTSVETGGRMPRRTSLPAPDDTGRKGGSSGNTENSRLSAEQRRSSWGSIFRAARGAAHGGDGAGAWGRASDDGVDGTSSSSCLADILPCSPARHNERLGSHEFAQQQERLLSLSAAAALLPPPSALLRQQRDFQHEQQQKQKQQKQQQQQQQQQLVQRGSGSSSQVLDRHEDDSDGRKEKVAKQRKHEEGSRSARSSSRSSSDGTSGYRRSPGRQRAHSSDHEDNANLKHHDQKSSRRGWSARWAVDQSHAGPLHPSKAGSKTPEEGTGIGGGGARGAAESPAVEGPAGDRWLRMRDPVTQRQFYFDPETRAAEWEGGEAMDNAPEGLGLGLLSQEERENLERRFERRQRRRRRSFRGVGGGVQPDLRERVLRKITFEQGHGGAERAEERGEGSQPLPEEGVPVAEALRSA